MVNQSLVPQNGTTAVGQVMGGIEGFDDFDQSDLQVPVIKIVYGVSKMEGAGKHGGEFWNSVTKQFSLGLEAVLLSARHSRALFIRGQGDKPVCASDDCVHGNAGPEWLCRSCQYNATVNRQLWDLDSKQNPRCNLGYRFLLYLPSEQFPAVFTIDKTNTRTIKPLMTQFAMKKAPVFGALLQFDTIEVQNDKNKWPQLVVAVSRWFDAAETAKYREIAQGMAAVHIVSDDDAEAPQTVADAPIAEAPADDAWAGYEQAPEAKLPF